jgi:hypothetical protein
MKDHWFPHLEEDTKPTDYQYGDESFDTWLDEQLERSMEEYLMGVE